MAREIRPARLAHARGLRATPAGIAAVAGPVIGWSFANTIVKVTRVPVVEFTFWRLWMGAAVMLAVTAAARRRITWSIVRRSAPAGALFAANLLFFFAALRHTGVVDVLLIAALQPALVFVVAGPLFGERPTRREIGWSVVSVLGVAVAVLGSSGNAVWSLEGDLLAVGSLLVWTAYFLISKRVRQDVQAVEYMTTVTVVAAVLVTPVAIGAGQGFADFRAADWMWLVLFVAAAQGGHLLLAWAHRQVDVTLSSLLILGEPVVSAVAALVVLGEPLTALQVAGGAIAVGAVGAIVWRAARGHPGDRDVAEPAPA
ncbi:MAG: DMT family transporter [Actinomycetota bacterium]